jgi:ABC transporter substrate binding protein
MTRLAVALLSLALLVAPLAAEAQPATKVYRVGFLSTGSPLPTLSGPEPSDPPFRAFVHDLRKFGYVEGQNLVLERRSAEGRLERLPDLAAELVRLKLDVIVASSGLSTRAVKHATTTIPIVMDPGGDPIHYGSSPASLGRAGTLPAGVLEGGRPSGCLEGFRSGHPPVHRCHQRGPQALCLDEDGRRDPRRQRTSGTGH